MSSLFRELRNRLTKFNVADLENVNPASADLTGAGANVTDCIFMKLCVKIFNGGKKEIPMGLAEIVSRVRKAEAEHGRKPGDVTLIAVSKMQPNSRVEALLEQGHGVFGENRVQEAAKKWPDLIKRHNGVEVHLIGPLQTNKVRQAFHLFQAIHSVDRPKLANAIARISQEEGRCPDLLIQVNTGEEPQKAGLAPSDADKFIADCRSKDLPVKGLMCIPPIGEEASPHFALLAKIAERNGIELLSMGMSDDFEKAISFGATHVRVGTAVFGSRISR